LSAWNERTSYPDENLDWFSDGVMCGGVKPEPIAPGQWKLVGIIVNLSYTPILDIYSDRTGLPTKNDSTFYYHFRLSAGTPPKAR
jgi:hypothetical protein